MVSVVKSSEMCTEHSMICHKRYIKDTRFQTVYAKLPASTAVTMTPEIRLNERATELFHHDGDIRRLKNKKTSAPKSKTLRFNN